jgi:hypothetical protein
MPRREPPQLMAACHDIYVANGQGLCRCNTASLDVHRHRRWPSNIAVPCRGIAIITHHKRGRHPTFDACMPMCATKGAAVRRIFAQSGRWVEAAIDEWLRNPSPATIFWVERSPASYPNLGRPFASVLRSVAKIAIPRPRSRLRGKTFHPVSPVIPFRTPPALATHQRCRRLTDEIRSPSSAQDRCQHGAHSYGRCQCPRCDCRVADSDPSASASKSISASERSQ